MKQDTVARFISRLETLGGIAPDSSPDRRALAALRRSLSTWPAVPPVSVRVVAPFLPKKAAGRWETTCYLIAGLFAMHPCLSNPGMGRGPTLGQALREAAATDGAQGPERRLLALLGCRSEDLPNHLRHTVSYLRARDVSIDYCRLMRDVVWWDRGEGDVQRHWGRDFWSGTTDETLQKSAEHVLQREMR